MSSFVRESILEEGYNNIQRTDVLSVQPQKDPVQYARLERNTKATVPHSAVTILYAAGTVVSHSRPTTRHELWYNILPTIQSWR